MTKPTFDTFYGLTPTDTRATPEERQAMILRIAARQFPAADLMRREKLICLCLLEDGVLELDETTQTYTLANRPPQRITDPTKMLGARIGDTLVCRDGRELLVEDMDGGMWEISTEVGGRKRIGWVWISNVKRRLDSGGLKLDGAII